MEASFGEVKIEFGETKVGDEIINGNDLALWYMDNRQTQVEEEFVEQVVQPINLSQRKKNYVAEGYKDPVMEEWEKEISEMIYKNGKNWFCKLCDYKHHRRGYAMSHVETYHPPNNFPCYKCLKCDVVVVNRLTFQVHISRVHSGDQPEIVKLDSNNKVETAPDNSTFEATDMTEDTNNDDITDRRSQQDSRIKEEDEELSESSSVGNDTVKKPRIFFKVFNNHPSYKSLLLNNAPQMENSEHLLVEHLPEKEVGGTFLLKGIHEKENSKHLLIKSLIGFIPKNAPEKQNDENLFSVGVPEKESNIPVTFNSVTDNNVKTITASRTEHQEPFKCELCQYSFKLRHSWAEHMGRVHGQNINNVEDKYFKCDLCDYVCLKSYYLQCHKNKFHNRGNSIQSKKEILQTKSLPSPGKIQKAPLRALKAKNPEPRICQKCGGGFINEESFAKHMIDVEGIDIYKGKAVFICKMCSKGFKYAITLKDHTQSCGELIKSKKNRLFKCAVCSSKF